MIVRRDGSTILDDLSIDVYPDQRWVVLGPNGSGKTTLLRIMALYDHPSSGTVEVLGERLGQTDVRTLRSRLGYASSALADQLRPGLTAHDAVRTARHAALEPWWHRYSVADDRRADECLRLLHVDQLSGRALGSLSSGERQRVLLARALMNDPAVLLLDEPSAGLDLGGREELVATLAQLARERSSPPCVMVTHHVDEIPQGSTHVLLLRDGRALSSGPIGTTLDSAALSECFGVDLVLERRGDGRFSAWARS
ncbi:MAG: ATP-binding cassette domain-containing protein [Acidimicrobiia bacterium]|nr:ATP-binding cassette domain-containing protein [Acidimicrobiia bacterium]